MPAGTCRRPWTFERPCTSLRAMTHPNARAAAFEPPNIIEDMDRRTFFRQAAAAAALVRAASAQTPDLEEITIGDLVDRMRSGQLTARSIAEQYLARIESIDRNGPALRSVIETNPDALAIADSLDRERKEKGPRGPMHGIPVLIKDNIDTADRMKTTAGSLALADAPQPGDAAVAKKLREAGAVILGKTNLSEWANIRSSHSTSGLSGRGGQTRNPYALDRNPCGSSSGSGAAASANLCAAAVGTETDGSVVCPSSANGIVGIKPTLGLLSRSGIIPIAHSQDTAGPMTRTVADAAIMLGAMAGVDPADSATEASHGKAFVDYTRFLDARGLRGARIGVVRKLFSFNNWGTPSLRYYSMSSRPTSMLISQHSGRVHPFIRSRNSSTSTSGTRRKRCPISAKTCS